MTRLSSSFVPMDGNDRTITVAPVKRRIERSHRRHRHYQTVAPLVLLVLLGGAPPASVVTSFQPTARAHHHRIRPSVLSPITSLFVSLDESSSLPVAPFSSSKDHMRQLEKTMVQLGRRGDTDRALALLDKVEHPSIRLWNGALDACARARPVRLDTALHILEERIPKPNVFSFGALLSACSRAQQADLAIKLLREMEPKYKVTPNAVVYSSVISACARSMKKDTALKLLKEAVDERKLQMSVVGFNAAISACAQAGDWRNAVQLLERMEAARNEGSMNDDNNDLRSLVPAPDAVTYGTVLSACEKGGQWERLLQLANSKNVQMDGLGLTSCLHACQQLGLAEEAQGYLEKMKLISWDDDRKTMGLKRSGAKLPLRGPDAVAYNLAISACARGGAWQDGLRLLAELEEFNDGTGADVMAYTSAITGCEYAGEWERAFQVLDQMRRRNVQPNEVTMAAVIGACATACAQLTKAAAKDGEGIVADSESVPLPQKKALQLLSVMKKDPTVVNPNIQAYNAAIRVCAEACDLRRAMVLFEEIQRNDITPTIVTYGTLMTACERVGCVRSASKVFKSLRMEENLVPNEIVYGAAISCCRKAGQSERALLLFRKMMKEGLSPNVATYNTVILAQTEGQTSRQDLERALLVYKLMKKLGKVQPNRQTYTHLILCFASREQPALAETFIAYMRDDGFVPDVNLYTATVTGYERVGQPLKALQLMESMQEDGYDFYSIPVLNVTFKKAVKLANAVGRGLNKNSKKNMNSKADILVWNENDIDDGVDDDKRLLWRQTKK